MAIKRKTAIATTLSVNDQECLSAIERAKHEWEGTADALPALVCLLDSKGVIVRANRVVEHWRMGTVGGVIGRQGHELLHPTCHDATCELERGLRRAQAKVLRGNPHEFKFYDSLSEQNWHLNFRPIGSRERVPLAVRDRRFVLVVADVSALRRTEIALERLNASLESQVQLRTRALADSNRDLRNEVARRERAELELRASSNELTLLSEQLIQTQERERRRIALELHDSVSQSLSAVKYTLERAVILMQRPALGSAEPVLALAVQRLHETAESIRAISMNLRPQMLDDLGAASAITWFCREFSEVYPAITIHVDVSAENAEIPERIAIHLFRSVQELLNNVAKHSKAKNAWVRLWREGVTLSLDVHDDGVGLDQNASAPKFLHGTGLRNIRERAEMTGGQFVYSSIAEKGMSSQIQWQMAIDEN